MKNQKNIMEYLSRTENPYKLEVGDISVEIIYSENNKKFYECMINILKQRLK